MQSTGHSGWQAPHAMQLSSIKNAIGSSLYVDDLIIEGQRVKNKVIRNNLTKKPVIRMDLILVPGEERLKVREELCYININITIQKGGLSCPQKS